MRAQRHLRRTASGLAVIVCMAIAVLIFATPAGAAPNGNGNGNANANGIGNGNANANANANANGNSQAASHQTSGTAGTSGTVTSPQPLSNADNNGVGPNVSGPYDSTRDGSLSLNGNGNGNAVGEPCAGCVGKADNKNPPGQLPGPSDINAGYECDRNNGIGKTNPAHTGCVENVVTPPVTPPVLPPIKPPVVIMPSVTPPMTSPTVASAAASRQAALAFTGSTMLPELFVGISALFVGLLMLVRARPRASRAAS
jgi:hypothetical protein